MKERRECKCIECSKRKHGYKLAIPQCMVCGPIAPCRAKNHNYLCSKDIANLSYIIGVDIPDVARHPT